MLRNGCAVALTVAVFAAPYAVASDNGDSTTGVALRYRYEHVDQDDFADSARASTLRLRLDHRTTEWNSLTGYVEFDAVTEIFADDYNSGAGTSSLHRNRYPVVADPGYTEVNQAYLQHDGFQRTTLRVGRQRILLDNQRFVGGVGWRQNEQTYDGVSVESDAAGRLKLFYSYVANVNRIFGDDVAAGDHDNASHLLHLAHPLGDSARLRGYLYSIDNRDVPSLSTLTAGMRLTAKTAVRGSTLDYALEYAWQRDAANNAANYSADYWHADATVDFGALSLSLGFESLEGGGDEGAAFRTPLATLHAFNGWADKFLSIPGDGLEDIYAGVSGVVGGWSLRGTWHLFRSESGDRDYGTEADFSASLEFGRHFELLLKAALFNARDSGYADTNKAWLMLSASY